MSQYFSKPYERSGGNIKVEFDLFNYTTKTDLKGTIGINRSNSVAKSDLVNSKAEVYEIDIDKLRNVSADKSELRNLEDNDFV